MPNADKWRQFGMLLKCKLGEEFWHDKIKTFWQCPIGFIENWLSQQWNYAVLQMPNQQSWRRRFLHNMDVNTLSFFWHLKLYYMWQEIGLTLKESFILLSSKQRPTSIKNKGNDVYSVCTSDQPLLPFSPNHCLPAVRMSRVCSCLISVLDMQQTLSLVQLIQIQVWPANWTAGSSHQVIGQ